MVKLLLYPHPIIPCGISFLCNKYRKEINYPGPEPEKERPPAESFWRPPFLNIREIAAQKDSDDLYLSYDVVIVGSGAGYCFLTYRGSVTAAQLSQAGHRVLVLEKAKYTHPDEYPLTEYKSFKLFYERGGFLGSDDGGIQILAGTSWGGGTTVNWSASLSLPEVARKEWAEKYGLDFYNNPEYQDDIDAVRKRLGMGTSAIKHNIPNSILQEGCKKLNYTVEDIPQNTAGHTHSCGWCTFGCPYGEKQSGLITWIKDAVEHGCHLIQQAFVVSIVHEREKIVGLKVLVEGKYNLFIKAKRIVASCGSINTPALLLRSKINNPNIGKNLKLHPVCIAQGYFPDRDINPHNGSIMTVLSNENANVNGNGYGSRLEVGVVHPGIS